MVIVNVHQPKTQLSRLLEQLERGEEVVIARAGKPVVKLIPNVAEHSLRKPGGWEGRVWIADDFDDELPEEIAAAFEGRAPWRENPLDQVWRDSGGSRQW